MDLMQAMRERHSVRSYTDRPIEAEAAATLIAEIEACNRLCGTRMKLVTEEPDAFSARYGRFRNVRNYIVLLGEDDEALGYCGERIVLVAQALGLNTCWVGGSYKKKRVAAAAGERPACVVAVGYGTETGAARRTKSISALSRGSEPMPEWFRAGMEAVRLAPSALNSQNVRFEREGNRVRAVSTGGFYRAIDLGIAKFHFELGAGEDAFEWAK